MLPVVDSALASLESGCPAAPSINLSMTLQGTHFSIISNIRDLGKLIIVLEGATRHKITPALDPHLTRIF
jgi:hypothetical protein